MVQKVTRVETEQSNEISILIGQYIDLIKRCQKTKEKVTTTLLLLISTIYEKKTKSYFFLIFLRQ